MIDGKVCNSLSDTPSSQICYICKAKPYEMNDEYALLQKNINYEMLSFEISPLHPWYVYYIYPTNLK